MQLIRPDWPVPTHVHAVVTTREGGASQGVYASLNLGDHVGDEPDAVALNRQQLITTLGLKQSAQWLSQVHGSDCVEAQSDGQIREADACFTRQAGQACVVMTADCLPVFFCNAQGTQVAVAHAGWRGLAGGVLTETLKRFDSNDTLLAWLGPAIGVNAFEVGAEVKATFCQTLPEAQSAFYSHDNSPQQWWADIYQLARLALKAQGVDQVYGGNFCTFTDAERFFSYRRDGQTGRMASVIWFD